MTIIAYIALVAIVLLGVFMLTDMLVDEAGRCLDFSHEIAVVKLLPLLPIYLAALAFVFIAALAEAAGCAARDRAMQIINWWVWKFADSADNKDAAKRAGGEG